MRKHTYIRAHLCTYGACEGVCVRVCVCVCARMHACVFICALAYVQMSTRMYCMCTCVPNFIRECI